jgi:hypothetical protein
VTAGPFAETREQLLGHYIIQVQVPAMTHGSPLPALAGPPDAFHSAQSKGEKHHVNRSTEKPGIG